MKIDSFISKLKPVAIGTSMADMALLLLVFFMVSTSTEPPRGAVVDLPEAVTRNAEQEGVYITISNDGAIFYDGKKTSIDDLRDSLAVRRPEKDRPVSVTADRNLPYRQVRELLSTLRDLDFLNIIFMADSRGEER